MTKSEFAHIALTEQELSELLFFLPPTHYLRPYLQQIGKSVFGW